MAGLMTLAVAAGAGLIAAGMAMAGSTAPAVAPSTGSAPVTVTATAQTPSGADDDALAASTGMVDVSDVAAAVVDSVVTVDVTIDVRGPGHLTASGSGIVLTSDGTIVTNAHVVENATAVTVTLADGSTLAAEIEGIDISHDLAVLTTEAADLSPVTFGTTVGLEVGDPVIAVGNPLGLEGGPSVTTGIVSALGRVLEDADVNLDEIIQTDAAITEGSSGGALFDAGGRLIGVTTAVGVSNIGIEGIGFAIRVETVTSVIAVLAGD